LVLLILAAVFCMIYPNGDGTWTFDRMLVIGTVAAIVAGEIVTYLTGKSAEIKKG
jgi:mannose/fructose/N-acetylgalactosamine-specific phosphotransferase system component IIC